MCQVPLETIMRVLLITLYFFNADANYFAQKKLQESYADGDEREFDDIDDVSFEPDMHSKILEIQPCEFAMTWTYSNKVDFYKVVLYFSVTLEPGSWFVARLSCIRTPEDIYVQPVKVVRRT